MYLKKNKQSDEKGDSNIVSNGTHTDWQFFLKAEDAWESMFEAVRDAKKEILCEQYILGNDHVGKKFLNLLMDKAREGLGVQIIVDMVGGAVSGLFYDNDFLKEIEESGVKLIFWNPVKLWRIDTIFSWFFRNHRKLMVIDEHVGFVGGVGFREDMKAWRDTHLKVVGPVVEEMRHAFLEMWALSNEKRFFRRLKKTKHFTRGFQFITNSPSRKKRFLYEKVAYELAGAQKRILLTTPYFIPDRKMSRLLRLTSMRGVEVKILIPKESNHPWVDRASRSVFGKLLKSGVDIYRYEDAMLHAKTLVVDDKFATVGSFNFDSLSFNFNYEGNVISHSSLFIDQVAAYFEEDCSRASKVNLIEWKNRSLIEKIQERIATFIRRLL